MAALPHQSRFSRSSLLVFTLALSLLALSAWQRLYRLSLPTDGWTNGAYSIMLDPIFSEHLLAVPSDLVQGDKLLAINGTSYQTLAQRSFNFKPTLADTYIAGKTIHYTVLRDGKELILEVPLYTGNSVALKTRLKQIHPNLHLFILHGGFWLLLIVGFTSPKTRNRLSAYLFFLFLTTLLASDISWLFNLSISDVLTPLIFHTASFFGEGIHSFLALPLSTHIILSFPEPRRFLHRHWSITLIYGPPLVTFILMQVGVFSTVTAFSALAVYYLVNLILVATMVLKKWTIEQTLQARWFGLGFSFYFVGMVFSGFVALNLAPKWVSAFFSPLYFDTFFLSCVAIAILRHRLFDINLIINRALVYGGLSLTVVSFYALMVGALGRVINRQNDFGLSLLATGLIALGFNPLRERLQRGANRLLYGYRDEPYKVLAQFGQTLEATVMPARILPLTAQTISQTLKLPFVEIAVRQDNALRPVATLGQAGTLTTFPLVYAGKALGELRVSPREGERKLSRADGALLGDLARQVGVAAHALLLQAALERSKLRVITAREEARRRLGSDLHDSVGHSLAGLVRRAETASNLLATDPVKAQEILADFSRQGSAAIRHVRALAHSLHPPELELLGLLGSVREWAGTETSELKITLELPETLPALLPAVEVAAYYILREAVHNVVKHASATRCVLKVGLSQTPLAGSVLAQLNTRVLELAITDNGTGFMEGQRTGLGLASMRERAIEVGGSFEIHASRQGTAVSARLPYLSA